MRANSSAAVLGRALVLGLLLSGCGLAASPTAAPTSPPAGTPSPLAGEQAPTQAELEEAISADLNGDLLELDLRHDALAGNVFVRWDIAIGDTNDEIIDGAMDDTVVILREVATSGIEYQQVRLSGWYTLTVDINLNTEHTEVLDLTYYKEKLDQLHWERVRPRYIWVIADQAAVHYLFQQ